MTTYRVNYGDHKGIEYPEYTKFPRQQAPCGITWVALEVAPNRVLRFESSQLTEVKSPFDSGMLYTVTPQPQDFDSGLIYDQPQPFKPLIIALPAHMIGQEPITRGKNKRPTIPGVILADCAHVTVIQPVSLWHPGLRAA